MMMGVG